MPAIIFNISSGAAPFLAEVVGEAIPIQYIPTLGTYYFDVDDCGDYTIKITDAKDCVVTIAASCACSTTTTETTTTSTPEGTTTTTLEGVPCNYVYNYYRAGYVETFEIDLGTDTGNSVLEFNTYGIPSKIIVNFDGADVIDTGYRGNTAYQTLLNTRLTTLGQPTEVIAGDADGSAYFYKGTATSVAYVSVYSPILGAVTRFILGCLEATTTTTTNTTTTSTTTTTTEIGTTTTTEEATTTTTFSVPWNLVSDVVLDSGTVGSGNYMTTWVNDNTYFDIVEAAATPGYNISLYFGEYEEVPTSKPLLLNIKGWYEGNPAHNVKLQIYNKSTSAWDNVTADATDFPSETGKQDYNFVLPGVLANYVTLSGILKTRIVHTSAGTASHNLYLDYVSLFQINETTTTSTTETTTTTT